MKTADTSFDGVSAAFYDYERSVRGAVRYELSHENISEVLPLGPLNVLDIGGGTGPGAAWSAGNGNSVLLVEPSGEQLKLAQEERFPQLSADVQDRIETIQGTIEDLPASMYGTFDFGMSHGVAMYLDDPEIYWQGIIKYIKPGGLLSVFEKGFGGTAMRLVRENKIDELREFLPSRRLARNNMGRAVQAFTLADMKKTLQGLGCEVVRQAGIRHITDHMYQPKSELPEAEWNILLKEERLLSRDIQEMHCGQMLQLIVRKK